MYVYIVVRMCGSVIGRARLLSLREKTRKNNKPWLVRARVCVIRALSFFCLFHFPASARTAESRVYISVAKTSEYLEARGIPEGRSLRCLLRIRRSRAPTARSRPGLLEFNSARRAIPLITRMIQWLARVARAYPFLDPELSPNRTITRLILP